MAMKATAVAHPIQGLIKYHGLADPILRLPFHDSISVCTAPMTTRTTVEFADFPGDQATIEIGAHEAAALEAPSNDALDDLSRHYPRVGAGSCDHEPSIDRRWPAPAP